MERDDASGIARLTLDNPERRNAYDPAMREQLGIFLDELAYDDAIKVVILRGEGGVFSTGADMNNAYAWYGDGAKPEANGSGNGTAGGRQEPSAQPTPSTPDRPQDVRLLPLLPRLPEGDGGRGLGPSPSGVASSSPSWRTSPSWAAIARSACRPPVSSVPALGSLHMFFYRLGPVLARRLLLTGDTIDAAELAGKDVFTEVVEPGAVESRAAWWAEKVARMPADGIVMAKEAFRLIEQLQGYQGEEVLSYLFHAYGTNLRFEEGEFNFVKTRAEHGTRKAFELRDEYFEVPEPEA